MGTTDALPCRLILHTITAKPGMETKQHITLMPKSGTSMMTEAILPVAESLAAKANSFSRKP